MRYEFDNTEHHFTGTAVKETEDGRIVLLLDKEFADTPGHKVIVNSDYLEEIGPQWHGGTDATREEQLALFTELQGYSLQDRDTTRDNTWVDPETGVTADYLCYYTRADIKYYLPNDENWGDIIAVDVYHKLAIRTGFYDWDDIQAEHGEYSNWYSILVDRIICGIPTVPNYGTLANAVLYKAAKDQLAWCSDLTGLSVSDPTLDLLANKFDELNGLNIAEQNTQAMKRSVRRG